MPKRNVITATQLSEIESARKATKNKNADRRLKALSMHAVGAKRAEIAKVTEYNEAYISKLVTKYCNLGLLTEQMYQDTMTLNTKAIQGGSLTNVAIQVAMTDLDLKTDAFETCTVDVVSNILDLIGITGEQPKFKRRTIVNDTEMVTNISTMLADDYIDDKWAIENNPLISDEEQDELLARVEARIFKSHSVTAKNRIKTGNLYQDRGYTQKRVQPLLFYSSDLKRNASNILSTSPK